MRRKFIEAEISNRSLGFALFSVQAVGERSVCVEGVPRGDIGAIRSENAGMSNDIEARIFNSECPRFPHPRLSCAG